MTGRPESRRPLWEARTIGDSTVKLAGGLTVRVKTIHETAGPDELGGGCACHQEHAHHGTAIFWPADGPVVELFQYRSEELALQGHGDTLSALIAGDLVVEDGRALLTVTAACGHDERVGLPFGRGVSIDVMRDFAVMFGNCKACLASVDGAVVPAEGCER